MKHTPGPWEAVQIDVGLHYVIPVERTESRLPIAVLDASRDGHEPTRTETNPANASLIATAPELLAAVKALLPEGWGDDDTMDHMPGVKLARAAIAKAEGRPDDKAVSA